MVESLASLLLPHTPSPTTDAVCASCDKTNPDFRELRPSPGFCSVNCEDWVIVVQELHFLVHEGAEARGATEGYASHVHLTWVHHTEVRHNESKTNRVQTRLVTINGGEGFFSRDITTSASVIVLNVTTGKCFDGFVCMWARKQAWRWSLHACIIVGLSWVY